jgi:glycosyltransferase involved in cell wall biosynthesis
MRAAPASLPPLTSPALPEISVVIAHLNQPELLGRCLAALERQSFGRARFEVIVVDNGSRRSPAAVIGAFPGVRLAEEPLPGPGPARNRGAALARGAILAFTDADCLPDPGWLAAIHARFAAPELEILGGEVTIFPASPGDVTPAEAFQMIYAYRQELYIHRQGFSVTANLAVRRAVFDEVGPFAGLEVAEDADWGRRATGAGRRIVYAPEVRVLHPARDMAGLYATWDRHVTHFYRLARGPLGRLRWVLTIPLMALSPAVELPTILRSRLGPRERWRAFRGLARIRLYRAYRMAAILLGGKDGAARWNR